MALLGGWGFVRGVILHRWDDFGLPDWFVASSIAVGMGGLGFGLMLRAGRRAARAAYTLMVFVDTVLLVHLEQTWAPGHFWPLIAMRLVLLWPLWGPASQRALGAYTAAEADARPWSASRIHMLFAGLCIADLVWVARLLGNPE